MKQEKESSLLDSFSLYINDVYYSIITNHHGGGR